MKDNNQENILRSLEEALVSRKALLDNYSSLNKVADYCENVYSNAQDTRGAVEESKALTTQALASVAYQINTLATSVLKLLDSQTVQLKQMESSVNVLSMTVGVYKEKVARQEIGVLTASCKIPYTQKILPPAKVEKPSSGYERIPISYSILDSVGHGLWDGNKMELKKQTEVQKSFKETKTRDAEHHFGSNTGIAVPPPSIPFLAGFKTITMPSDMPASPLSHLLSTSVDLSPVSSSSGMQNFPPLPNLNPDTSPIPTLHHSLFNPVFRDSYLPLPPTPQESMSPLPSPPPSPPYYEMAPPPPPSIFETSLFPSKTGKSQAAPPPPPRSTMAVGTGPSPSSPGQSYVPPPPPPPPSGQGYVHAPHPSPSSGQGYVPASSHFPPSSQSHIPTPSPPPPPPPGQSQLPTPPPPPPPPPGQSQLPTPPPPPPGQSHSSAPPPPPSGNLYIPPPPPLPPFKA